MSDEFTLDLAEFERAIIFVLEHSNKTEPEVVNRAALTTIIGGRGVQGAMQRTPKADAQKIKAQLTGELAERIVEARARKQGLKLTRQQIKKLAAQLIRQRVSAAGYTRGPGWTPAAQAFGGRGVRTQPRFGKSVARFGYGHKASPSQLVAEIANFAPAADKIGRDALQDALNDASRDMVAYWTRRMQQGFDKVKPR
jgi:hypothetical protein